MSLYDSGEYKRRVPVSYNIMLRLEALPIIGPFVPLLLFGALTFGLLKLFLKLAGVGPETEKGMMMFGLIVLGPLVWTVGMRVRKGFHHR